MKKLFVVFAIVFFGAAAQAKFGLRELSLYDSTTWDEFKAAVQKQEENDRRNGQAYMISGTLLVLGGMVGYHNAQTSIEKLAFSVTQSLGVAGIGYGAYLYNVGNPHQSFFESLESTKSLSTSQKDDLVRHYVADLREDRTNEKFIKIVTHSIVSFVNFYNGMREEGELRQGLMALGGIHALAAISVSFQ